MKADLTQAEQAVTFFMKTNTEEFRYRFRNPDNSSVFRSELAAIREALNLALDNRASDTWILTDSKSSIQFSKDWSNILDMLGQDILLKLAALTQCICPRLAQTTLSRLRANHTKSSIFNGSEKTYASCRCLAMASPSPIIACIGASVGQLLNEVDVVFNLIKRHSLLDLV
ncbi:RNase H domain-containing protein [Trichonephila clavata]|uniref:RNase H domain-containing protein n=1 Tax=Trichonephila clavata TaxID=2740835 RepID=A0A8X6IJ23_TRICU|nr:RNase H domain-containing protein [Trichonephila clavata]